jgi:hypothetical protein
VIIRLFSSVLYSGLTLLWFVAVSFPLYFIAFCSVIVIVLLIMYFHQPRRTDGLADASLPIDPHLMNIVSSGVVDRKMNERYRSYLPSITSSFGGSPLKVLPTISDPELDLMSPVDQLPFNELDSQLNKKAQAKPLPADGHDPLRDVMSRPMEDRLLSDSSVALTPQRVVPAPVFLQQNTTSRLPPPKDAPPPDLQPFASSSASTGSRPPAPKGPPPPVASISTAAGNRLPAPKDPHPPLSNSALTSIVDEAGE